MDISVKNSAQIFLNHYTFSIRGKDDKVKITRFGQADQKYPQEM